MIRPRIVHPSLAARSALAPWRLASDERGFILPLALIVLVLLAAQSAALLALGGSESRIAANHLHGTQALFLAEAGIEDGFAALMSAPALLNAAPEFPAALPGLSGPGPTLASIGTYEVTYQRAGPDTVRLIVTATTSIGGAERRLRATVTRHFLPRHAILAAGSLAVDEHPSIHGRCGSVHADGDVAITGSSTRIDGTATAAGAARGSSLAPDGSVIAASGGLGRIAPPAITAAGLLATAQSDPVAAIALYELDRNGRALRWNATTRAFETVADPALLGAWQWTAASPGQPPRWRFGGGPGASGTFYVEGDVDVSATAGTGAPWAVTIIAARTYAADAASGGTIHVGGQPQLAAHLPGLLLAADGDIALGGTADTGHTSYAGVIVARGRIDVGESPTIHGALVAAGAAAAASRIAGSPTITFDCDLDPPLTAPLAIVAWGP
jgi:hypothetical protein